LEGWDKGGWLQAERGEIYIRYKEDIFCNKGGEALEKIAQRGGRCPIPGSVPGHVGQGSEHPDPGEDVSAHCRGLGWMALKGPFQPKAFCDSTILEVI